MAGALLKRATSSVYSIDCCGHTQEERSCGQLPRENMVAMVSETVQRPVVCVLSVYGSASAHQTNHHSCGASEGTSQVYLEAARSLAHALHRANIHLVYGGSTLGLMGELARTLVSLSGPSAVHGIIPGPLLKLGHDQREVDESVYGRRTVVKDMHTRKQMMAREVEAGGPGGGFVALAGGYGTCEELMEVITWNQLGIHSKPVVLLNSEGYWNGLLKWLQNAVRCGFVSPGNARIPVVARSAEEVITSLTNYQVAPARFNLTWAQL